MNDQIIFNFDEVEVDEPRSRLIPWIVIGAIAILAILVSLIIINTMGKSDLPGPTTAPAPTETTDTSEPTPSTPTEPTEPTEPSEPEPTQTPPTGDNPDDQIDTSGVVIGTTSRIDVPYDGWDMSMEVPNKLASWTYEIDTATNSYLIIDSDLINRLPDSCAHMRDQWGIHRDDAGDFTAHTPQQMCEENESLYTEILGLIQSIPATIEPLD